MIINLYIEINRDTAKSEYNKKNDLVHLLRSNGFAFFDATEFDSYTSGTCALDTLEEIEKDIREINS